MPTKSIPLTSYQIRLLAVLALINFVNFAARQVFVPLIPPIGALLPVQETLLLLLPALAACCLVGWWAGGRFALAVIWVALAAWVVAQPALPGSFYNLVRGWSLLLAGAFGLV